MGSPFGQRKILPDTLHNTEFIDVVRIKDTTFIINEWRKCKHEAIDEIIFPNGEKIYCKSAYRPTVSENGKMVVFLNYPETPYNYVQFKEATLDVYNYERELIKSYQFYTEKNLHSKPWGYSVFNNGNLLVSNLYNDSPSFRLYLYQKDTVINMFDQKFGKKSINNIGIKSANCHFFEDLQLIFVNVWCSSLRTQFHIYDYSGNFVASYDFNDPAAPYIIRNIEYDRKNKELIITYELYYKLIFNITTKKFTNNEE